MSCGLSSRTRPSVEFLSRERLLMFGTPLVDCRKRQTPTATLAKPGDLPRVHGIGWAHGSGCSVFTMWELKLDIMEDAVKEEIIIDGRLCAILLRADYDEGGLQFFTSNELSQQLASMSYKPGKIIPAHTHQAVRREVLYTQEALFVRKGKLRVDFYSADHKYHRSRILGAGDVILLIAGGHGFEVLEELNMVEVKQGPYAGDGDKLVFSSSVPSKPNFE
jgi:mannose-6-phosphate isomerase-like protein (cupin superfamily)